MYTDTAGPVYYGTWQKEESKTDDFFLLFCFIFSLLLYPHLVQVEVSWQSSFTFYLFWEDSNKITPQGRVRKQGEDSFIGDINHEVDCQYKKEKRLIRNMAIKHKRHEAVREIRKENSKSFRPLFYRFKPS